MNELVRRPLRMELVRYVNPIPWDVEVINFIWDVHVEVVNLTERQYIKSWL